MTMSNSVQSLVSSDRPTVVLPPISTGQFQGWGIRIN